MNAVQRFIRSKVLLLTAAILIAAMCLSVLVQSQSQAALNRTVDENSRGLYDVLVQAKEAKITNPLVLQRADPQILRHGGSPIRAHLLSWIRRSSLGSEWACSPSGS